MPPPQETVARVQKQKLLPALTCIECVRHFCGHFCGRWRVLCFPSAGSAEDMFTSEGTGSRKAPSPLLVSTASGPLAGSASAGPLLLGPGKQQWQVWRACTPSSGRHYDADEIVSEQDLVSKTGKTGSEGAAAAASVPAAALKSDQPAAPNLGSARAQEWCRANGAECLAVQAPGRLLRGRERPITRAADLAAALLPVVASRLGAGVPYVVRASRQVLAV